jgi:hypothetical protein
LDTTTGGWFKKRNPTVSHDILTAHWVDAAHVLYIGKAGASDGSATLRSRLRQYLAFGSGKAIGHWGGRLIWHLPDSENLVVCWKITPDEVPRAVEQRLIQDFVKSYGRRPFANLTD